MIRHDLILVAAGLTAVGCIQVAGLEDVEPLPDAAAPDAPPEGPREIGYLKALVPDSYDSFGSATATTGDIAVIGAPNNDSGAPSSGAAFVFDLTGTAPVAQIEPHHNAARLYFGKAVAASGDTVVVGAMGDDSAIGGINVDPTNADAVNAGAAHVFVREGDSWRHQAYIKPSNPVPRAFFGQVVAIDGDTVVVGAPSETDGGAVYVFVRTAGEVWSQQARLGPRPGTPSTARFGGAVAIRGDHLVVGAPFALADDPGTAHLFARRDGAWSHRGDLVPADSADWTFGAAVAIGEGRVAIGAPDSDVTRGSTVVTEAGQVHLFDLDGRELEVLNRDPVESGLFGLSLAIDAETVAIGCALSVDIFERAGDVSEPVTEIRSVYSEKGDQFGADIALAADRLVVGAPDEDSSLSDRPTDNTAESAGAAYLFEL